MEVFKIVEKKIAILIRDDYKKYNQLLNIIHNSKSSKQIEYAHQEARLILEKSWIKNGKIKKID
jgi:IS1 family transposase